MNPKTDSTQTASEFSSGYLQLLVAISGATLVLVFGFERLFSRDVFTPNYFIPFPWIIAAGRTIADGLSAFSGEPPAIMPASYHLALLADMLVVFVLGPTLFFLSWRKRRMERELAVKSATFGLWTLLFVVGGVITFGAALPAIPIAIFQRMVSRSLYQAQAVQSNKDFMINEINVIAWNAHQHKILPKSVGGGEGAFSGYSVPKELGSTEDGEYDVTASPNQCTIKATSKKYPSAEITVILNEAGRLQEWSYKGLFE